MSTAEVTRTAVALHEAAERLLEALYPHRHQLADCQPAIAGLAVVSMLYETVTA